MSINIEKHGHAYQDGYAPQGGKEVFSQNKSGIIRNPLVGWSKETLMEDVKEFARRHDLEDILPELKEGALVSQNPILFEEIEELSEGGNRSFEMKRSIDA